MSETLKSIYDGMSTDKRAAADVIFGAITEKDDSVGGNVVVSGDKTLIEIYASMSELEQQAVCFMAEGVEPEVAHYQFDSIEDVIEHYGVKGMRWGIRNDDGGGRSSKLSKQAANTRENRKAARAAVKAGNATLGEAHLAALKSKGHRVANAMLGDKTYWKRAGIIAAVGGVGVGASFLAPAVLPSGLLSTLGMHALAAGTVDGGYSVTVAGTTLATKGTAIAAGKIAATQIGLTATSVGTNIAGGVNQVTNLTRAIGGNTRINNSFRRLGTAVAAHQASGSKRVATLLKKHGGLRKKDVTHGVEEWVDDYLAHYGRRGMKWGRTIFTSGKSKKGASSESTQKKGEPSDDYKRAAEARSKHPSTLSNKDMQDLITRMNLEKQYAQVMAPTTTKPTTRTKKTAKWVQGLLLDIGKTELSRVSKGAAALAVEQGLSRGGQVGLAKRIAPKKKK